MSAISRCIFRWGLISVLALGGATLLIGPERVAAGLAQLRTKAQSVVDRATDNPAVLRQQLQKLADEYPTRIAKVKSEIGEVDRQIEQFHHDSEVASRVIAMTDEDLGELKTLIARADKVDGRPVYVRFAGVRFHLDQARSEAHRIMNVNTTYQDRMATNDRQLTMLEQQKARLAEILTKLQDEQATFETQMWQLDRQIDAIERNDRLIAMTKELQATLDSYDRWGKLDNLKQLQGKLAELKTIQDAQLEALERMGIRDSYEDRARYEIEVEETSDELFEQETDVEDADSVAWLERPLVVE